MVTGSNFRTGNSQKIENGHAETSCLSPFFSRGDFKLIVAHALVRAAFTLM